MSAAASIASIGLLSGGMQIAALGLLPEALIAVPPAPTFSPSGAGAQGIGRTVRPRYLRDDDLIWLGGKR